MSKATRNDPCPCGSGKKYKKCCWGKDQDRRATMRKSPGLFQGIKNANPVKGKQMLKNVKVVTDSASSALSQGLGTTLPTEKEST